MRLCIIVDAWCYIEKFHRCMCHTFLLEKRKEYLLRFSLPLRLPCIEPLVRMNDIVSQSQFVVFHVALHIVDYLCMALRCLCDPYPDGRVM
jgi:hypothetical protein